ncbi:MAG: cytochrome b/b6 domain-containing protein [Gammaproteobacteria bacterium]|jgi:cytochrome b561
MTQQTVTRYSRVAIFFHWLTVILVILAFILGPGGSEERIYAAANDTQRHIHETLGMTIFILMFLRLAWRWMDKQPVLPPLPPLMVLGARLVQYVLYLLLFVTPLTAITGAWLQGHAVDLVFGINIGPWIGPSHHLGSTIAEVHGVLGDTIIWLAGFHALAAIFHHVMRKEDILVSMLPQVFVAWLKPRE